MLTFGSLFSGIGGFDIGLEWAGMKCGWQVEIDDYCLSVLAKHWPNVQKYRDIKEITELPQVDLICGGFPCQDISNAGKRKGITGERSGLWKEMLRIIRMVRPKYIIVENVAALINRGLSTVLGDLAESGYDAEWQVLSAAAFGAPHLRERVFIVAYPKYDADRTEKGQKGKKEEIQGKYRTAQCARMFNGTSSNSDNGPFGNKKTHTIFGSSLSNEIRHASIKGLPDWTGGSMGQPSPLTEFERPNGKELWDKKTGGKMSEWEIERIFCNVDDGISYRLVGVKNRVNKLKALGNAVVPQIVEYVGRLIIDFDKALDRRA